MTDAPLYRRILVPVDGSDTAYQGLAEAIRIARLTGGRLRIVHVVDALALSMALGTGALYTDEAVSALDEGGQAILDEAKARAAAQGVEADTRLHQGPGARLCDLLNAEARDWGAELMVLGSHGRRGIRRLAMGSDAEQVLRHAEIPVLVVRSRDATSGGGGTTIATPEPAG